MRIFQGNGIIPFHLQVSRKNGMTHDRNAQSLLWGFLAMLIFIVVSSGLVDIYRLYAARNWAYSVAQEAAMAGASIGRDWTSVADGGDIRLNGATAQTEAQALVLAEMNARGVTGYEMDVRVLPDPEGGSISGYPPDPVRLGEGLGNWTSNEPAVGVYLEVPVSWLMLDTLNIESKTVRVFAAAGVAH
jgi:hypothetical protein